MPAWDDAEARIRSDPVIEFGPGACYRRRRQIRRLHNIAARVIVRLDAGGATYYPIKNDWTREQHQHLSSTSTCGGSKIDQLSNRPGPHHRLASFRHAGCDLTRR